MQYLIPQTIDQAAQRHPEGEAVRIYDRTLTYGELARRSNQLARVLRENGVQRRDRVGIYLTKSVEAVIALYGILKAGAAYVPLDPAAPPARTAFAIRDCGIRCLITQKSKIRSLQSIVSQDIGLQCAIGIESVEQLPLRGIPWEAVFAAPDVPPPVVSMGVDLAYIIYTSGSTGTPKGIMHTHESGLSFARWAAHAYGIRREDRLSNQAPLHFDMSIFDFFVAAVAGAATVIIPDEYLKLPASYARLLQDERITVFFTVPFALSQLLSRGMLPERDLSALRWIIFGGDTHSPRHIRQLMEMLPHTRFSHMYGPAETNGCTYQIIDQLPADPDEPFHIGKACEGMEALVLDENGHPVETGGSGELLIRTPTMMQGYWNRPDLNERVFYRRTVFDYCEDIFYRTGDLVEILPDGNLKFLGRKDRMIKIRGFRVELDEIEMALLAHPAVEECAVFTVAEESGSQQIQAAVILKKDAAVAENELAKFLRERLPGYAVPHFIDSVQAFPRTPSGKVDRRKLQQQAQEKKR